ncbi:Pimeloyl-ACP methyl ester carboxylesterase [Marinobacter segnicrescens]|uniref:Pimeloyl-ACP methyl ester carboxylesterase n=1 Tax=Marinobacter segnicrescens TaxID=430453 RepID=A0A1I0BSW7_9GAMM|nr:MULTISPECIES: alpha/beta hydrolase [Marinobacter]UZD67218.1 alpha/beta hydrolase [Marinobacter sp. AN1]SET09443.1 Pimeloyl-ACP methyl ester carboxylesterase [Marinobacter segnicrescens]
MPDSPVTALLIHGAWAGGWVWDAVTPCLEGRGFTVLAPDLPGCGERLGNPAEASLDQCVENLKRVLEKVGGPLLLVGHSGGGAVVTQLAEAINDRVVGVAYLAGMMLPTKTGFGELVATMLADHPEASGIGPFLQWDADGRVSRVPDMAIRDIFLQDVSKTVAEQAIPRFGPQAEGSRALVPQWTPERFGKLPRLYIEALRDRSVVLPVQRRMQALVPGAQVVSLDTGHVPQVAAPQATADALAGFVAGIVGPP